MAERFRDRSEAGRALAALLAPYAGSEKRLVLALPRGGLPVAREVARALHAPLDVFVVRKLGVPRHEELAMGAIASGGLRVLNNGVIRRLGIPPEVIDRVAADQLRELLQREQAYRGNRPPPLIAGRTVFLVDDGIATGATMRVAVEALRTQHPRGLIVAVPVAAPEAAERIRPRVTDFVSVLLPDSFLAVGQWYDHFPQLSDEEVRYLLAEANAAMDPAAGPTLPDARRS